MKRRAFSFIILAFAAIAFTSAQDLDKILDSYFKTIGQEKILKVKTMHVSGSAVIMGMDNPFQMTGKRPDKVWVEIDVQGTKVLQGYDGTTAWAQNPYAGSATPVEASGQEEAGIIESADMDGQLWKYKEKGHQLELAGTEEVNGSETWVLKLTKKNGNIDHYYMDKEKHLVLRVKTKVMVQGMEMEAESLLSNYQEVDGYLMPFTTEQRYGGQTSLILKMDEVKFGVEVDEAIFAIPAGN